MKLIAMLTVVSCIQLRAATTFGQTVSLNARNVSLETIFESIRNQTGYNFLFLDGEAMSEEKVTIQGRGELNQMLSKLLDARGLAYSIQDNTILVTSARKAHRAKTIPPRSTDVLQLPFRGKVLDEHGNPLEGATVRLKGTDRITVASEDGSFSFLQLPKDAILVISFTGYQTRELAVSSEEADIFLVPEAMDLSEVVVVGYGTQKRATVTGAVATIQQAEIVQTKNENVLNALTGRVPGLRVRQQNSEPGLFGTSMDIRGMGSPLVIIDGVPRNNIEKLDPNDIESISILKDASAAIYGVQAANGVVLVTTKTGAADNAFNIDYSGSMILQAPSGLPRTVGAVDYMRLANELDMNRVDGAGTWRYSQELIDAFLSGELQSTDWNSAVNELSFPTGSGTVSPSVKKRELSKSSLANSTC
ncbi:TonB-dependent receptor plug domain-containing protein [Parapedobacter sp. ISTM3]|uniref:TonB-dependent receptor plug domain-containing protein n=1 Tax=Parapedobacter sp. ISTM3 TaxID=2800130 RepID=UPI001904422B|nr:TonB-dependent receptor plug domain-containing protein [Parapedobacter sp. ISTM3]MBK1439250.1 TonB-dependent receptor plug domain-containing protein [Parapedobacter sp. ISTM3]